MDFRRPLKAGNGPERACQIVRERIAHADADREFGTDMREALACIRNNERLRTVAARQHAGLTARSPYSHSSRLGICERSSIGA